MEVCVLGLSIRSSWGNGHATTYRSLLSEFAKRGHKITFLERDQDWYRDNTDKFDSSYLGLKVYRSFDELRGDYLKVIQRADVVILGSYVPAGAEVADLVLKEAEGLRVFYDIDTPVSLEMYSRDNCFYLNRSQIKDFDLYLSFSGGRALEILESKYHSPHAEALYCSVDTHRYKPVQPGKDHWVLGYLGTYAEDRQESLSKLLVSAAQELKQQSFVVAGPQYPEGISWPENICRKEHISPSQHPEFFSSQDFTLNLTRKPMRELGHSPSVRLFEAAACGVPIISDRWPGIEEFFSPEDEILIAESEYESLIYLTTIDLQQRQSIGMKARKRVEAEHTSTRRAEQLETILKKEME